LLYRCGLYALNQSSSVPISTVYDEPIHALWCSTYLSVIIWTICSDSIFRSGGYPASSRYKALTPFTHSDDEPGVEPFISKVVILCVNRVYTASIRCVFYASFIPSRLISFHASVILPTTLQLPIQLTHLYPSNTHIQSSTQCILYASFFWSALISRYARQY
jgi:hypothetical protein